MNDILGDSSNVANEDTNVSNSAVNSVATPYDWHPVNTRGTTEDFVGSLADLPEPLLPREDGSKDPLVFKRAPQEPTRMQKLNTAFSMLGSRSNVVDFTDIWDTRTYGENYDVPKEELLKGVPDNLQSMVLKEAAEHNDQSALLMRDQILQDVQNNTMFDNMEWYEQLGYGAVATIVDPLSLVPAGLGAKGVGVVRAWQASGAVKNTAVVGAWAAAGGLEGASMNAPRLFGDHTYSFKDYELDVLTDAAIGVGFGAIGGGISVGKDWYTDRKNIHKNVLQEKERAVEAAKQEQEIPSRTPAETQTIQNDLFSIATPEREVELKTPVEQQTVTQRPQGKNTQKYSAAEGTTHFEPIGAIDKISPKGFKIVHQTVAAKYPPLSPMRKLLDKTAQLNSKNMSPELHAEVTKLNSDVVKLLSLYPNGRIPDDVNTKISGVTWTQVRHKEVNALDNILTGKVADTTNQLNDYVDSLKAKDMWEGNIPEPISTKDFYKSQDHWLGEQSVFEVNSGLHAEIPKELSYLKDLVELNKLALEKNEARFTELVEQLNGMAIRKTKDQVSSTDGIYATGAKGWGKTVKMTPPEIAKQLKAEGLVPKTAEYKARLEELKKFGMVSVSPEVNKLGKVDERIVGHTSIEQMDLSTRFDDGEVVNFEGKVDGSQTVGTMIAKENYDVFMRTKEFKKMSNKDADIIDPVYGHVDLVSGNNIQDLLPRTFTKTTKSSAFKAPTAENIKILRDNLRSSLLKHTGVLNPVHAGESFAIQSRLVRLTRALQVDKERVMQRLVKSGSIENVVEVLRAANTAANIEKMKIKQVPAIRKVQPSRSRLNEFLNISKGDMSRLHRANKVVNNKHTLDKQHTTITPDTKKVPQHISPTEEHLDQLHTTIKPEVPLPPEQVKQIKDTVLRGYELLQQKSAQRWVKALTNFVSSGEKDLFDEAIKPSGVLDYTGKLAARWTESLANKFLKSDLVTMKYIGARIPELGTGFGGRVKRPATGGIYRDKAYRESLSMIAKPYVDAVEAFAESRGKGALRKLFATQRSGADDELVKEFNRSVFEVQELRRQGRELPKRIDKSIVDFVDQWDVYMAKNHDTLVSNNVGGFTANKKIKHYIPHVWLKHKFVAAIDTNGKDKILTLLERAYLSSSNSGVTPLTPDQAKEAAETLLNNVMDETVNDLYSPTSDSRAKQRTDLDTTMSIDGLSVMDLLDDEVIHIATKYSNRVAGWVGLSKSTDGNITSQLDIDTLKANLVQEGLDKKIDTKTEEQYFDDLINLMFGRPTRDGLTTELRELKDLTALTRMGGLGTAQLIESGQVLTRVVLQTMGSPQIVKQVFKAARGSDDHNSLIREIQSISSITDDMEWLDRQSVHLDQAELQKVNKLRQASLYMADKATWGSAKAPASRALGKVTGYNAVRRIQSRVAQASFTLDVANHFKHGTGKMGSARMADLGLTDVDGKNTALKTAINTHADWDINGNLVKLNFDKWDKVARETFQYALIRDEAQQVMRAHVGELPPWMNSPLMSVIFQFRQMPILAQGKSMARNLAFADKEAVLGVMLNTALAGVVRYSKFAALGTAYYVATGEDAKEHEFDPVDTAKYVTQFGMYADLYDLVLGTNGLTTIPDAGNSKDAVKKTTEIIQRQIPILGLMKDYTETVGSTAELEANLESAQGLVPLGNTLFGELVFDALISAYNK